jgi:hypothetical protein
LRGGKTQFSALARALAISFLVVGLGSLFLRNVSVVAGLLLASLFWLLVALFYLTKEHREKVRKIVAV